MSIIATSTSSVGEPSNTDVAPHNLQVGYDGSAGKVVVFPPTTDKGMFEVKCADNAGDFEIISINASMGQATTFTLPDPGASTAKYLLDTSVQQMAVGAGIRSDKSAGTSSAGAVTINKQSGVITSESLSTAAGASATITLTNSFALTSSVLVFSLMGGTNTTPGIQVSSVCSVAGTVVITIANLNASAAFNGTVVLGFTIV